MISKDSSFESYLNRLEQGENEDELKAQFLRDHPEYSLEDWALQLRKKQEREEDKYNPLVLLASENGAFRALSRSILSELETGDEVASNILPEFFTRMKSLSIHFEKVALFFPELTKKVRNKAVQNQKELEGMISPLLVLSGSELINRKEEVETFLYTLENNICFENQVLLPELEEKLSSEKLLFYYKKEMEIGFALIRIR